MEERGSALGREESPEGSPEGSPRDRAALLERENKLLRARVERYRRLVDSFIDVAFPASSGSGFHRPKTLKPL